MNPPNLRVERIQGRLRIMDTTARRIVRDEFHELLRIEHQLKELWKERAEKDKKLISISIFQSDDKTDIQ